MRAREPAAGRPRERTRATWTRRSSTGSASSRRTRRTSRWWRSACSTAYREAGRAEEGLTLLAGYLERYPSLDLLDTVFQQTLEAKGPEQAYALVRDELRAQPDAARPGPPARGADHRRGLARQAQGSGAGAQPGARAYPAPGALSLRDLRLQGAPVPLALPGLRRLGDLSAAAHRRVRTNPMKAS